MYGFTYITTNLINGMKYIGRRKIDKYGVWKTYLGSGRAFKKALAKYGKENFKREIIQWYETSEELNEAERLLIERLNAVNDRNYYNLSTGGNIYSGFHIPEESKKIISEKVKASYTEERRNAYSDRMKNNNPNKDGNVFRGKHLSEKAKENLRQINIGKLGLKGTDNPMYGMTEEKHPLYRDKSPFARAVMCIETEEVFSTCVEAGIKYKTSGSQISLCCKGVNKTCMGFHWKYINEPKIAKSLTEEQKKKISESKMGKRNPMSKPVLCIETGIVYSAAYEAGRAYNVHGEAIANCCKGRTHTAVKLHWRYATPEDINNYNKKRTDDFDEFKDE